ncbi:MAG: N-acetylneuraminate synthase family protein [Planctomycetota bacterium]|jgi:sialic acid synthase SpsE/CMP-N-acetylneuraminic acid synthetase
MRKRGVLAVVIGRAGSKGLPGKNTRALAGRPLVCHTIEAALAAETVDRAVVSTDGDDIAAAAASMSVAVVRRPPELATDTATVASAVRHAVETAGDNEPIIVILYANVPIRPPGLIDRAVGALCETGADSVQSYTDGGKHHPCWMVSLDGDQRVHPFTPGTIDRRQDLPKLLIPDGGVIAVTRASLLAGRPDDPHAFLGADRRGLETAPGSVVDIDTPADLRLAEVALCPLATGTGACSIGDRRISADEPPYVIAELGVNHDGRLDRALELVEAAHAAGADAVKVQWFEADHLLSRAARLAGYQETAGASDPFDMLRGLELSADEFAEVVGRAHAVGLAAVATVFSVDLVAQARELDFDAFKTASPDIVNRPLIETLMAAGKPLLVSTGTASIDEVQQVTGWLGDHPHVLLQCVSGYPTPDGSASLAGRAAMCRINPNALGYSDHTTAVDTGGLAVASGACLLEKHLTYDRTATGPDHATSLDGDGFKQYVDLARRAWQMLGPPQKRVLEIEEDVRRVSRQSITATQALPAGHELVREDLTIKRPGTGIPPWRLAETVGRRLATAVEADMPLRPEYLE